MVLLSMKMWNISGSGKVEMAGVAAQNAVTHTSGSGDVKLALSTNLDAHISGSGSVYLSRKPDYQYTYLRLRKSDTFLD